MSTPGFHSLTQFEKKNRPIRASLSRKFVLYLSVQILQKFYAEQYLYYLATKKYMFFYDYSTVIILAATEAMPLTSPLLVALLMAMVAIRLAKMVQDGCGMEPDGQKSLS